jgi:hypothetical protein
MNGHSLRVGLWLTAIVAASVALSIRWVFLVPIFQSPDEPQHFDYALCLNERRALIHGEPLPADGAVPLIHPWTNHLRIASHFEAIAFHPKVHVSPDYGTPEFYEMLKRSAPAVDRNAIQQAPILAGLYPFGYYSVLAVWLEGVRLVGNDPVTLLFGARLFSVLLLCITLIFTYATARELHLKERTALLLTAAIGLFPLTSFISSYVQPDNLGLTLASICFYLSLRLRRQPDSGRLQVWLGLASAALLVTKPHFYLCVFGCGAAALIVQRLSLRLALASWLRCAVLLLAPALAVGMVHLYVTSGVANYYGDAAPVNHSVKALIKGFNNALMNYYAGPTHDSFWGVFGWMDTPLMIASPKWTARVHFILQVTAWLVLGLTLLRLAQVASRLFSLWRRGRRQAVWRIALSNVPVNSYFLFTVLMFALYIRLDNRFAAQGRNWFPFLLPIFLTAFVYAPRALAWRGVGITLGSLGLMGLLLYDGIGGYYSLRTIEHRYYAADPSPSRAVPRGVPRASCPCGAQHRRDAGGTPVEPIFTS